ncbi:MAG: transketolase family protein [Chloroflexi bacterium]|nr:transketolase family protein [Chloroflexota bacterium]
MISTRDAYGQALVQIGKENPNIIVLDADLSKSTRTSLFAKEFPGRFFDCGIAEQNTMSIAAGLAASGKVAFASTFAVFAPGRCFDQLRMSIAQPGLNVKVVSSHGGVTVGEDGASHQSIEDLALASVLPNFTVIVPCDGIETVLAIKAAASIYGPFYIRLSRQKTPNICQGDYKFIVGKAATMRAGKDITIIALGIMVSMAMEAAEQLKKDGIDCRVINVSTIKPIDREAIIAAAVETGAIVTAEEHLEGCGFGSMVAQVVAENHPVPMRFIAVKDKLAKSGTPEELLKKCGLTSGDIQAAVKSCLSKKG